MSAIKPPHHTRSGHAATLLILAAIAIRLLVSDLSWGTDDAYTWRDNGLAIGGGSYTQMPARLMAHYRAEPTFNHPPLMGLYSGLAHKLAAATGLMFPFVFRLLPIAADVAAIAMLWPRSRWLAVGFALDPVSILTGAHHCNTDNVYAAAALAAMLAADRRRWVLAGALLGLACNVKIIPVLLLPALLANARPRDMLAVLAAFIATLTPLWIVLLVDPVTVGHNVFAYTGGAAYWGPQWFLRKAANYGWQKPFFTAAVDAYAHYGKWLMAAALLLLAVRGRRAAVPAPLAVSAAAAAFLAVTPGFGPQYLALLPPLLWAARPRFAAAFAIIGGTFLLKAYLLWWDGTFPAVTVNAFYFARGTTQFFGLGAWALTVAVAIRCYLHDARRQIG